MSGVVRERRERADAAAQEVETAEAHHDERVCPECGGDVRRSDTAGVGTSERACTDCGLVVAEKHIDRGPEWRARDGQSLSQDDRSRVGSFTSPVIHDDGVGGTQMGLPHERERLANGSGGRYRLYRLHTLHKRERTPRKTDRNRAHGNQEILRMASALGLGDPVREQACQLFRDAQAQGVLKGLSIEAVATAALRAACRANRLGRPKAEFAAVARVDAPGVDTAFAALNEEMNLPLPPPAPATYVPRLVSGFDLSDEARRLAGELVDAVFADASGLNPSGVAAGCVYAAAVRTGEAGDSGMTQADVAEAADVSILTVRNRFHDVERARGW